MKNIVREAATRSFPEMNTFSLNNLNPHGKIAAYQKVM